MKNIVDFSLFFTRKDKQTQNCRVEMEQSTLKMINNHIRLKSLLFLHYH